MRWQWQGPLSLLRFQMALERLLLFSRQNKARQWLVDISKMPPLGNDEQAWLSQRWVAQFARCGIQNLALMLPDDLHNQLAMEHVLDSGRCYTQVNVQFFGDFPAALDWLSKSSDDVQRLEHEWFAARLAATRPGAAALLPDEWLD
ncbi:hypothetical protein [Hymenobacter cavernae]|uniref:STAS/SEC14 domain-containing protein n=1 Tax=Hymenobacter cavernae TaxID=2044852 RepID=A0ABQ1UFY7_9BACT|nr:hypothetical protein [Hymenobacter cavernae]GGF16836.1 hypothetical protein GCM10011383_30370 [Hymenobacter cavernae]